MHRVIPFSMLVIMQFGFAESGKEWVRKSDQYTQRLLAIEYKHKPELGSQNGLAEYDKLVSDFSLEDEQNQLKELNAALEKIRKEGALESDERVQQDLALIDRAFDLRFRTGSYTRKRVVLYLNASKLVFQGIHSLLDDQVAPIRRISALDRLRKYAGLEGTLGPCTQKLKERSEAQMSKPNMRYPSKRELETELGRNSTYLDDIERLFKKYQIKDFEKPFAILKQQLIDYDDWVRETLLPKAESNFRLPPELYALTLEGVGVDMPAARLAELAHKSYVEIQAEMQKVAAKVSKQLGYSKSDYRSVIAQLKKKQISGEAIVPLYKSRLALVEEIIRKNHLVSLPIRPALIRLATAAESAQQPSPHMTPPPLVHNTGERGVFVLPLRLPAKKGDIGDKFDDYTYDAASWTITAHEARPGHELQFDSMLENGVSLARALYGFSWVSIEGWGLYSELIMQPFEPLAAQLITLQLRLLRTARAFLDPELQEGKITPEQAYAILRNDIVLSHAFATQEIERYTFRQPGQAASYFYGYMRLLDLRKDVEKLQGVHFDQMKFHDFILAQGLLPHDLLRRVIMHEFVAGEKL